MTIELDHFRPTTQALYRLTPDSCLDNYLSDQACSAATEINRANAWRLNDKTIFPRVFAPFSDYLIRTFGSIVEGEYLPIDNDVSLETLLRGHKVVVKPSLGTSGKGVEVIDCRGEDTRPEALKHLALLEDHVVTEWVHQSGYAQKIWPHAANTIRVLTMSPEPNCAFIAAQVHRFGNARSGPTDNWNRGGLSSFVYDFNGGIGSAAQQLESGQSEWYGHHPDTNGMINGAYVPDWEEIVSLALDLANFTHVEYGIPYVGWDFVSTPDGPRLLEANADPGVHCLQVHWPLLADERVRLFYKSHGVEGIE